MTPLTESRRESQVCWSMSLFKLLVVLGAVVVLLHASVAGISAFLMGWIPGVGGRLQVLPYALGLCGSLVSDLAGDCLVPVSGWVFRIAASLMLCATNTGRKAFLRWFRLSGLYASVVREQMPLFLRLDHSAAEKWTCEWMMRMLGIVGGSISLDSVSNPELAISDLR